MVEKVFPQIYAKGDKEGFLINKWKFYQRRQEA